ncbi:oxidoreductase [Edaphobacter acidisoli]|uniref:Oxidoreductase n=1 Tax=Edaphobacter acidisoli TaxID=2040573 RepID=A0A916RSW5_9BACT|nr:SDR family oxidoreductase [Edaphobacter acidisoli]GGA67406.1 oxidoreductase [Edaphobacter acidisoli]
MALELENKVVVLTGGGDGIGAECALAYAREGAWVAIVDRNLEAAKQVAEDAGSRCFAIGADVSDGTQVASAIEKVLQTCGRIDAVHNNAGVASPSTPLHETSEAEWDQLFRVNVKSVYWTTRFALPALMQSKGTILNTASMVGLIGQADHAAYVATKGSLISLTKAMAVDYAPHSIRVNAICPAAVWTPMLERWCGEQPDPTATRQLLDTIHLLGPSPRGDVIADVAIFLLSERSRFMTGCILPVSGGAELGYRRLNQE